MGAGGVMGYTVTFGFGGYCENCDPSHDHPLNNIVSIVEEPEITDISSPENGIFDTPELPTQEEIL